MDAYNIGTVLEKLNQFENLVFFEIHTGKVDVIKVDGKF